jgi:hypothetical protein
LHTNKVLETEVVAYLLEKGVVVESEVLDGAPLDLETEDEEEDFLFL